MVQDTSAGAGQRRRGAGHAVEDLQSGRSRHGRGAGSTAGVSRRAGAQQRQGYQARCQAFLLSHSPGALSRSAGPPRRSRRAGGRGCRAWKRPAARAASLRPGLQAGAGCAGRSIACSSRHASGRCRCMWQAAHPRAWLPLQLHRRSSQARRRAPLRHCSALPSTQGCVKRRRASALRYRKSCSGGGPESWIPITCRSLRACRQEGRQGPAPRVGSAAMPWLLTAAALPRGARSSVGHLDDCDHAGRLGWLALHGAHARAQHQQAPAVVLAAGCDRRAGARRSIRRAAARKV